MPVRKSKVPVSKPIHFPPVPRLYIGLDPGKSGGLAWVLNDKLVATPMPTTERDVWEWLQTVIESNPRAACYAVIERVGGFIGNEAGDDGKHRNRAAGHAMFTFGAGYGGLRMALIAAGIPFEEVVPRKWQTSLAISPRKKTETKGQHKNKLKARAQQLFPNEHITLATCDAILLAEYARRFYGRE